jgi:hypothetical protein
MIPANARHFSLIVLFALALLLSAGMFGQPQSGSTGALKARAVVLIVLDGLRWQEVFDGPENALMNERVGHVQDVDGLRKKFWRETPGEARKAVFPFLWGVVTQQGEIFGNQRKNSVAQVTNGLKFSYPGYNEC